MAFSMAGAGPSGPQINVTPLIDVLLTLVIIFMLVVSMDPEYVEKTQIPQPNQQPSAEEKQSDTRTVVIQIVWTAENHTPTIKLNKDDVRWEDLEERLARIYLTRVEKVAFVRGDSDVAFQYVASVIDLAHHAGVKRIGLLTEGQKMRDE